jgi:hypothetical protein
MLISVQYIEEEKKTFAEDPALYFNYRKEVERAINLDHACLFPGTDMQKAYSTVPIALTTVASKVFSST